MNLFRACKVEGALQNVWREEKSMTLDKIKIRIRTGGTQRSQ